MSSWSLFCFNGGKKDKKKRNSLFLPGGPWTTTQSFDSKLLRMSSWSLFCFNGRRYSMAANVGGARELNATPALVQMGVHSDGIRSSDTPVNMYMYDIYEYMYTYIHISTVMVSSLQTDLYICIRMIYMNIYTYILECVHIYIQLRLSHWCKWGASTTFFHMCVHMYAVALPVLAQMGIQDIFPHFFIYTFISSLRVDLFTCMYMNTFGFHVSFWIFRLYMYISKIESNYICTNICMYIYVRTYIFRLYISM